MKKIITTSLILLLCFLIIPPVFVYLCNYNKMVFVPSSFLNYWFKFFLNTFNVLLGSLIIALYLRERDKRVLLNNQRLILRYKLDTIRERLNRCIFITDNHNQYESNNARLKIIQELSEIKHFIVFFQSLNDNVTNIQSRDYLILIENIRSNLIPNLGHLSDTVPDLSNISEYRGQIQESLSQLESTIRNIDRIGGQNG